MCCASQVCWDPVLLASFVSGHPGKAVISVQRSSLGLLLWSCLLPRDLSFTMEFWVSLKCSVLILPSLSSATTSSLSLSSPLWFSCVRLCLLLVLPTAHLCSHLPSASTRPEITPFLHLPCTDPPWFLLRGPVWLPS